jgi:serine/threonine protein kinase
LVFIILLPVFTVWISTLVWVYRDAERCGKPGILVALLVGLLVWPVGLLVWLILRQDSLPPLAVPPLLPPGNCPQCGRALASSSTQGLCPACLLRQVAFESVAPGSGLAGFTPPAAAELAELFPQFESLELLGRGGMGAVYKARQTSLDRFVALKILPAEANEDPAFGERFQREARALAQLSHPNIVGVHDFGQAGAYAYLVMEFVDGANLRQLQRGGHLSPSEALAIVPQICEALQFAHDHGIVHRDIKPENILIDTQGRVKIADFGLAKMMRLEAGAPDLTLTRHAIGTPQYMAPEQIEKPETVDHRADIYSLGVVFYEMLTGELPIGRFSSPSQRVEVDVRLDEVVLKALEKDPSLRYQQASAFKTRVETVAGGTAAASVSGTDDPTNQPPVWNEAARPAVAPHHTEAANAPAVPVHPPSPAVPPARQKNSRWWIWLVAPLALPVLLGIALVWMFWSRNASPKPLKDPVPLELQLEVRGPSSNIVEQVNLSANQRTFTDIIRLPHASYQVVGHVMPDPGQGGGYILSVIVGNHPAHKMPGAIDKPVDTMIPVSFNSRYPIGKLQDDEFFVTLTRVDEAAASDTKTPVQVWWLLPLVLIVVAIAGFVWFWIPDARQAANESAISPDQPKLCPTAIWGVVQAAICLTLIPACFQLQGDQRTTAILALVAVGCSTAICGAIAISQIRRSEGKLYGMGLAVFDLVVPVAIAAASVVFLF